MSHGIETSTPISISRDNEKHRDFEQNQSIVSTLEARKYESVRIFQAFNINQ